MSTPGSFVWFARHEARLAWRDALSMMTAGRRERERKIAIGVTIFVAFMHLVAYLALRQAGKAALHPDLETLIAITAGIFLSGSAMLSQAMESVTRTFYTRSDLELILSSPSKSQRLFEVRIGAMALSVGAMSLLLIGPFVDVLIWRDGFRWFGAYGVLIAVSLTATALAVVITSLLFKLIGSKRTRLSAQIVAAVVGGAFVIGLQMAAMFSSGTISRAAFLHSKLLLIHVPGLENIFWWPARAALGDGKSLIAVIGMSAALFVVVARVAAARFASFALAASSVSHGASKSRARTRPFRVQASSAALRRKERLLLARDPWLMSQSLMQVLYLLPPAALLWHSFSSNGQAAVILVPVLAMAAGQLAGGLSWLAISGEDAPDLVLTAPIEPSRILRAKVEAVMECVVIVFAPFVAGLLLLSPRLAGIAAICILASAASATAIQFWFRSQAKRSQFRRRHTSSRLATFAEAFSSIAWAGTGAIAAADSWLSGIVALIALAILASVRLFSPARTASKLA